MSGETNETQNQFAILKSPSFLPLFVTQAISAFNDNAVRNGIAILITFDLVRHVPGGVVARPAVARFRDLVVQVKERAQPSLLDTHDDADPTRSETSR